LQKIEDPEHIYTQSTSGPGNAFLVQGAYHNYMISVIIRIWYPLAAQDPSLTIDDSRVIPPRQPGRVWWLWCANHQLVWLQRSGTNHWRST